MHLDGLLQETTSRRSDESRSPDDLACIASGRIVLTMDSDQGTDCSMEEIQISKFKATCLAVLDRVGRMRKPALVTRFGKPVAQILPPPSPVGEWIGVMQEDGDIRDDLIAPAADLAEWDVLS